MTGVLDGAGFMHIHVAAVGSDDAFIGAKERGDDGRIGLGAADEKFYFCILGIAGLSDASLRAFTNRVDPVARRVHHIRFDKAGENIWMSAFHVIAGEGEFGSKHKDKPFSYV